MRRRTFEVDKAEAKMMGVCSGLARTMGIDPIVVRIAFVVATLIGGWPWTVVAYIVLAMVGKPKRAPLRRGAVAHDGLQECGGLSDLDRRMAEIDHYVASSNQHRLAREIEELR